MSKMRIAIAGLALTGALLATGQALAFEIAFDWGDIPLCTTGNPNRVGNPAFTVRDAPNGTTSLTFKLRDMKVPSYDHGGGTVAYSGGGSVPAGAFKYKSPCPPDGSHTYQWTATALDAAGGKLGTAKAKKAYP